MKNWTTIIFMLLAGLGWASFGYIVMKTQILNFWIGWVSLVAGVSMFSVAVDMAIEPAKRW